MLSLTPFDYNVRTVKIIFSLHGPEKNAIINAVNGVEIVIGNTVL